MSEEMKESSYYKAAIEILMHDDYDWKAICVEIAKANPKLLCDAARFNSFQEEVRWRYNNQGKVYAIKFVRQKLRFYLRDAKLYVEDVCESH